MTKNTRSAMAKYQQVSAQYQPKKRRVVAHFDTEYGVEETKLEGWQRLCDDVGVAVGSSITQCKKALQGAHVNIVDFIEAKRNGQEVHHFPSRGALRRYTLANKKKRFSVATAKENGFLRALLIKL